MWQIDTTYHYKIWFSKNAEVFLDEENQSRFITAREQNPSHHFTFIFSSATLSSKAQDNLFAFCKKNGIKPIDFDKDIPQFLRSDKDKALYTLAKQEIECAAQNKGGNMAGASDCTRAIVAIVEKCGIYSDFDVELQFENVKPSLKTKAPVLLAVEFVQEAGISQPCLNNECLVFSFDPASSGRLSKEALEKITAVQDSIISRYAKPLEAMLTHPVKGLNVDLGTGDEATFIRQYFKENPTSDIFAFRQYVLGLTIEEYCRVKLTKIQASDKVNKENITEISKEKAYLAYLENNKLDYLLWRVQADPDLQFSTNEILEKKLALLKHNLYVFSVSLISGPINYYALNPETVPQRGFSIRGNDFVAIVSPPEQWDNYCDSYKRAGIAENGLGNAFKTQNSFRQMTSQTKESADPLALVAPSSDQSWTPLGELEKLKRMKLKAGAEVDPSLGQQKILCKGNPI